MTRALQFIYSPEYYYSFLPFPCTIAIAAPATAVRTVKPITSAMIPVLLSMVEVAYQIESMLDAIRKPITPPVINPVATDFTFAFAKIYANKNPPNKLPIIR